MGSLGDIIGSVLEDGVELVGDAARLVGKYGEGAAKTLVQFGGDIEHAVEVAVDTIGTALAAPFTGPGGFAGLLVTATGFVINYATGAAIPAFVLGYAAGAATNALVKSRSMNALESAFARNVFGDTLPDPSRIILTNLTGAGGRPFTVPNLAGEFVVNLGAAYDDPMHYQSGYDPIPGQLLIHELTHVWQYHYTGAIAELCSVIPTQVRYTVLGDKSVYKTGWADGQFSSYNPEQQATLIEYWYANGCYSHHPFYRYAQGNIRVRAPLAATADLFESNWRYCTKCVGLFLSAAGGACGVCPKDEGLHSPLTTDGTGDWNYRVPLVGAPVRDSQDGWRCCRNCLGLFYGSGGNSGVCPALLRNAGTPTTPAPKDGLLPGASATRMFGGVAARALLGRPVPHDGSQSKSYCLVRYQKPVVFNIPVLGVLNIDQNQGGQRGWWLCYKCQGLFWSQHGNGSCPAGSFHVSGTPAYIMFNLHNFICK